MRPDEMESTFRRHSAGAGGSRSWLGIWTGFLPLIQEPVELVGVVDDWATLAVDPPDPKYFPRVNARLNRRLRLADGDGLNAEVDLEISVLWESNAIPEFEEVLVSGKAVQADPEATLPEIDQFADEVAGLQVFRDLSQADSELIRTEITLSTPDNPVR